MATNASAHEKGTDEAESTNDYSERVAKRARWEDMSFALGAPGHIKVRNLSYGEEEASDHTYLVAVSDGSTDHCTCPADEHRSEPCKHRVAVEANEPVMLAAQADETDVRRARGMD